MFIQTTIDSINGTPMVAQDFILPKKAISDIIANGTGTEFSFSKEIGGGFGAKYTSTDDYPTLSAAVAAADAVVGKSLSLTAAEVVEKDGQPVTRPILIPIDAVLRAQTRGAGTAILVREPKSAMTNVYETTLTLAALFTALTS